MLTVLNNSNKKISQFILNLENNFFYVNWNLLFEIYNTWSILLPGINGYIETFTFFRILLLLDVVQYGH